MAKRPEPRAMLALPLVLMSLGCWVLAAVALAPACMALLGLLAVLDTWHPRRRGGQVTTVPKQVAAPKAGSSSSSTGQAHAAATVPTAISTVSRDPGNHHSETYVRDVAAPSGSEDSSDEGESTIPVRSASVPEQPSVTSSPSAGVIRPPALSLAAGISRPEGDGYDSGSLGLAPITPAEQSPLPVAPSVPASFSSMDTDGGVAGSYADAMATYMPGSLYGLDLPSRRSAQQAREGGPHEPVHGRMQHAPGKTKGHARPRGAGGPLSTLMWLALGVGPKVT